MDESSQDWSPTLKKLQDDPHDEDAWYELYIVARPFIFSNLYRLLNGNRTLAEDLCSEAFLRLCRYRPFARLRNPSAFRGYLKQLCRHLVFDESKRASRSCVDSNSIFRIENIETATEDAREADDTGELVAAISELVAELTGDDAKLFQLLLDGLTTEKIATSLSLSEDATYQRISRLRKKLQKQLAARRRE